MPLNRPDAERIAHRLAAAVCWFPMPRNEVDGRPVRDSIAHVQAEGAVITATITDYDGTKTEYRAEFRPVPSETTPVDPVLVAPAEAASEHRSTR